MAKNSQYPVKLRCAGVKISAYMLKFLNSKPVIASGKWLNAGFHLLPATATCKGRASYLQANQ